MPGLEVSAEQPTQPSYALRGISTDDFGIGTDSAVGVYVDGVYAGKTGGALLAFNDVERIEVLKGPQGTLFGRNSAAGAISIITNEPERRVRGRRTRALRQLRHASTATALLNLPTRQGHGAAHQRARATRATAG